MFCFFVCFIKVLCHCKINIFHAICFKDASITKAALLACVVVAFCTVNQKPSTLVSNFCFFVSFMDTLINSIPETNDIGTNYLLMTPILCLLRHAKGDNQAN